MISELDRRILAKACGLCWHEWRQDMGDASVSCIHCGAELLPETKDNPTFTTPDDWELVRVRVIAGPNVGAFHQWLIDHKSWLGSGFEWWLMRTPEQCCQLVCNWIKARPDLFPWVGEMMEGRDENQCTNMERNRRKA
jgi:hypothetical protein